MRILRGSSSTHPVLLCLSVLFSAGLACAQSTLTLASGIAAKGTTVSLNLSLTAGSSTPADLQWTLSYLPSDLSSLSLAAGPALTAAGKTLSCSSATGSLTCLAMGTNDNTISSGVVGVVTATVSSASTDTIDAIALSNAMSAAPDGTYLSTSASSGSISVLPTVSGVQCQPATLSSGAASTCTVTLSSAVATSATVTVSDNNSALGVPGSVTVAAGGSSATFTATAATVSSSQTVTVTATLNGGGATASISISPQITVTALQCTPSTVNSGGNSSCIVTLSQAAPTSGSTVTLSSNNGALPVPASMAVAAGSTTGTFSTTAGTVTANQAVTVTASLNGGSATASVTVAPQITVTSLQCTPSTVASGGSSTCTVTISQAAPSGGSTVSLSDNSTALTEPSSVTVAAGATTGTFSATAGTVTANQAVTVTASLNGASTTASVTVVPQLTVTSLQCTPSTVTSGGNATCTVTISQAAPSGGSTVTLSSSNSALTVPASVSVAAGSTTATISAKAGTVTSNQAVTITAALNGGSATASVTLTLQITVTSLQCTPSTISSGSSSTCTVTLSQAAPSGGTTISLSDSSTALTEPSSIAVAAGSTTGTFTATAGSLTANQTATITASLNGSSLSNSLTLQVATYTLAAAYAFDEGTGSTTADASGNGNTGTIHGATWTTNAKFGKALSFNGSSGYVDLGNGASLQNTGSMSWSAWIYATGNPPDDGQIIARSNGDNGWQFKTSMDCGSRSLVLFINGSGGYVERCGKTTITLNQWYYVAAVYNSSAKTMDVYVNGVLDDGALMFGSVPAAVVLPSVDTMIGKRNGGSFYFKGVIDNVRIYNSALSAAAIQSDMNTAVTSSVASPALSNLGTAVIGIRHQTGIASSTTLPASLASSVASALTCSPKVITAGNQAVCELRVAASPDPSQIQITTSSPQLKAPSVVSARANQGSLTFQVNANPASLQQSVTVNAVSNGATVQDTVQVMPASRPILTVPQKQLAKSGATVSFSVSVFDPTNLPVQLNAAGLPSGASFDPATGHFEWTPAQSGKYDVAFTATGAEGQSSSAQVTIDVSSGDPALQSVDHLCSPNALGSVSGSFLAVPGQFVSDPSGTSMALGGTKVNINGQYVAVLSVSPAEVHFLCPAVDPGTQLQVALETASGVTQPLNTVMQSASPWIFSLKAPDQNQGVVSFAGATELAMARNSRVSAQPAQPGDEILIWGTGFGSMADVSAGTVTVELDGLSAEVESINAVPGHAGVYTIQVRVPQATAPSDAVPLQVQVMGPDGKVLSSNSVSIAVEQISQ
jgi:uncharacterized protein (TIGR03437 family)